MKENWLFSDGTSDYRIPMEPKVGDTVRIRFRTAVNDVDKVLLWHGENCIEMQRIEQDKEFDYFETSVCMRDEKYCYFCIRRGRGSRTNRDLV